MGWYNYWVLDFFFKWLDESSTSIFQSFKLLVQPVGFLDFDQDKRIVCLRLRIGSLGILCTRKLFKTTGCSFSAFFVGCSTTAEITSHGIRFAVRDYCFSVQAVLIPRSRPVFHSFIELNWVLELLWDPCPCSRTVGFVRPLVYKITSQLNWDVTSCHYGAFVFKNLRWEV